MKVSNDKIRNNNTINTHQDIDKFNAYQAKRYSKLNKSLNKKSSSNSNLHRARKDKTTSTESNGESVANIWDRQYSSFCIARNISYSSILNYAFSMIKSQTQEKSNNNEDEKQSKQKQKQKRKWIKIKNVTY